jgi:hypothetical protein
VPRLIFKIKYVATSVPELFVTNWLLIIQAQDAPLKYACRAGHSDIIAVLVNNGANPNATNRVRIIELCYNIM